MTSIAVKLKIINNQLLGLYLPIGLMQKLQLTNNSLIPVYFGSGNSQRVKIHAINTNKEEIYLSNKLAKNLRIPYQKSILLKRENDGLRIGPIIGILTTDYTGKKFSNEKYFSNQHFSLFFKDLLGPEPLYPAFYFVFTPENVDWKNKTVNGYFYRQDQNSKSWEVITTPFPDVVYNRLPNRTIERQSAMDIFKQEYLRSGGKLFNANFFNKWDINKILAEEPSTKEFIPETYLNPTSAKLNEMVEKYPINYLKPVNGSLGLGIFKVLKSKNLYAVQYRSNIQNKSISFKNIFSLYNHIFSKRFRNRYLVQQGIHLLEHNGCPVDFRIQLHKNLKNDWLVVAIGAKRAGKGSVTTHLRTGGSLIDTTHFLEETFGDSTTEIKHQIETTSIAIADAVEKNLNSPIGELGLDIGIDKNSNIWLFEVNSKPGRSIFKHSSLKSARVESSKMLIEYAIYLAGHQLDSTE